jgi:hypothetical protein
VELFEVAAVDSVGDRDKGLIPSIVSSFISPDKEDRRAPSIECVEYPIRTPGMLDSQLPHVIVLGSLHAGTIRVLESHAIFHEQFHICAHARLLLRGQIAHQSPNSSVNSTLHAIQFILCYL